MAPCPYSTNPRPLEPIRSDRLGEAHAGAGDGGYQEQEGHSADLDPGLPMCRALPCFPSLAGRVGAHTSTLRRGSPDTERLGHVLQAAQLVPSQPHRVLPLGPCLLWAWCPHCIPRHVPRCGIGHCSWHCGRRVCPGCGRLVGRRACLGATAVSPCLSVGSRGHGHVTVRGFFCSRAFLSDEYYTTFTYMGIA